MPAVWLAVLLAGSLLLRLSTASGDVETLLLRVTSDDAFYYFQIARNLAAGAGASLDGETATNGFHPLWLLLVAAMQRLSGDPIQALHLSLGLAAGLGTASVALVYAVLRRLGSPAAAAWLAAAFYGLHPAVVVEAVNGLETALVVCTTALVVWLFLGVTQARTPPPAIAWLRLGTAGGWMLLARTDSVFVWGCVLLFLAVRARSPRELMRPVAAGAVSLAWLAPWLLWNLLRFGTIVQVSALALAEPIRADFLARHGAELGTLLERSAFLIRAAGWQLAHLYFVPARAAIWPFALTWLAGAAALLLAPLEPERRRARRRLALVMVPGSGILLALLFHAGVRWWTREWYFACAGWLGAVLLGVALAWLQEALERRFGARRRAAQLGFVAAGALSLGLWLTPSDAWVGASPHRVQQLEGARWLAAHTEPGARIGAFNAGILSYFSGRTVVNLDGVVNGEAYEARRSGRLMDYILAKQLDYLVDWRGTLPMAGCQRSASARCEPVATVGERLESFAGSPLLVLRVHAVPPGRAHSARPDVADAPRRRL